MNVDEKEYRCGVCNKCVIDIKIGFTFKCYECKTEFKVNDIGIIIIREPSNDWKKRNMEVWESIKKINYPPNYIEYFVGPHTN